MVGVDDQQGVLPEVQFIHQRQDTPKLRVAHAVQRGAFAAEVLDLFRRLGDAPVAGPVEVRPAVVVRVELLVLLRREVGLVRVERFDGQEPVVLLAVGAHEFEAVRKGPGLGKVLFRRMCRRFIQSCRIHSGRWRSLFFEIGIGVPRSACHGSPSCPRTASQEL